MPRRLDFDASSEQESTNPTLPTPAQHLPSPVDFLLITLWIGGGVAFLASVYLLHRPARTPHTCVHCGYDLSATAKTLPCPECGQPYAVARLPASDFSFNRFFPSALCTWPFAFVPTTVLSAYANSRGGGADTQMLALLFLNFLCYPLIQLGALTVGRTRSTRDVCILASSASTAGAIVHTLIILEGFVWHPDAFVGLALMGAMIFVLPASGYGSLAAAIAMRLQAKPKS